MQRTGVTSRSEGQEMGGMVSKSGNSHCMEGMIDRSCGPRVKLELLGEG